MRSQTTLARPVRVHGIGLHTGREAQVVLRPAESGEGIVFFRTDVGREIRAISEEAGRFDYSTSLGPRGEEVGTVEHLLSAAFGSGLDNLYVEVDGPELPILDGSALPWIRAFRVGRIVRQSAAVEPIIPSRVLAVPPTPGKRLEIRPARELRISYSIDFDNPAIGEQSITLVVTPDSYARHLAPARTFGFLAEYEYLKSKGLARGARSDNCIVVGSRDVENGELRFADEFVRHKALDLLGDLALVGRPLLGHVVAHRAGHAMHTALAQMLRADAASHGSLAARDSDDGLSESFAAN
ncbi:MAG TPA: UDP-3-O-acyl-N-acetylglucosamine deacetylase [Thermoanaerobaculia bacterium]